MAVATAWESLYGAAAARETFYDADWFGALLALLAVNASCALAARYPFKRAQVGFVITHGSLLVILAGALITRWFGVEGQVILSAGESADAFMTDEPVLEARFAEAQTWRRCPLRIEQAEADTLADQARLGLDGVQVTADRYLPDARLAHEVRNDGKPGTPAVEITLAGAAGQQTLWLFAARPMQIGPVTAELRVIDDPKALAELLSPTSQPAGSDLGELVFELAGQGSFRLAVEPNIGKNVPLGRTAYQVKIVRYLPHAVVRNGRLVNASDEPVNPTVELEITGPGGTERRFAFARFPEFDSVPAHGGVRSDRIRIRYIGAKIRYASPRLELLAGPDGRLYACFVDPQGGRSSRPIAPGQSIETPWMGPRLSLTVQRFFERARTVEQVVPIRPPRPNPRPAVHVTVQAGQTRQELWLLREQSQTLQVDGRQLELRYGWRREPLGFVIGLEKFHIGTYPGTRRPRSFESHVVIEDARRGLRMQRVISMNHPLAYNGFRVFQSGYDSFDGTMVTFLQVSRDPGQWVVYTGYALLLTGMAVSLGTRLARQRGARISRNGPAAESLPG